MKFKNSYLIFLASGFWLLAEDCEWRACLIENRGVTPLQCSADQQQVPQQVFLTRAKT